ncbi:Aste57867_8520 [Aphanomyces stellatus]|uniref:Aste57867_8520 protein n=1 Tax=Aphanomyces stellatus TaxID=120398 RepID=A0A485KKM1_9STRA|nr:hypothetical protein As57867_008488 [Aphanomyces stellatus]VFT85406.1 Aste57867_8520 [Aphanomyces stellatus]
MENKPHRGLSLSVLKSILLHPECVLATIKHGYISKFMGFLATALYQHKKRKADGSAIPFVLDVLVNVANSVEGRAEICQYAQLHDLLSDLFANAHSLRLTTLLIRHLSFTTIAKTQILQWKNIMQSLFSLLHNEDPFVCNYSSCAVWSILFNNQRVTSNVLTELDWSVHVAEATTQYSRVLSDPDAADDSVFLLQEAQENLHNIHRLVECNADAKEKAPHGLAVALQTKFVGGKLRPPLGFRFLKLAQELPHSSQPFRDLSANTIALPRVKFDPSSGDHEEFTDSAPPVGLPPKMAGRQQPPPKPKRNYQPTTDDEHDNLESDDGGYTAPVMPRRGRSTRASSQSPPSSPTATRTTVAPLKTVDGEPETTIGAAVKLTGDLSFERLLRIDGQFEGKLLSKGSLVIGPKAQVTSHIEGMKEVLIAGGRVFGNVTVERLVLRDKGQIFGNVTAKSVRIDPDCVVIGTLNVNPHAPQKMNFKGEPVADEPKPVVVTPPA